MPRYAAQGCNTRESLEWHPMPRCEPWPDANTIRAVTDTVFKPGDDVFTTGGGGTVIDVRATPVGKWVLSRTPTAK
jgi:hypothetical protein